MAPDSPDVKRPPPSTRVRALWSTCMGWIDRYPRLGWWIALLSLVNVLLNLVDLFK